MKSLGRIIEGTFKGHHLPSEVVEKIYYGNASKLVPALKRHHSEINKSLVIN